jgi:HAMP domain-containing protein
MTLNINSLSIQIKHTIVFSVALLMILVGFYFGVQDLKRMQLRNEAQAVAEQVVSFRAWVAGTGVVWVDQLTPDFHDFLGRRMDQSGGLLFSKNPALATRELSTVVAKSSSRATFRVTSDEYRNPANKPDGFESRAIELFKKNSDANNLDSLEGGVYRYAQPIFVKKACLRCHGKPEDAPKDVIEKYGDKRAFGYNVGDVRGIIGVTLPDIKIKDVAASFINPITLALIIAAFLLSFLYTQRAIIYRLRELTKKTHSIARGNLKEPIKTRGKSEDEIEQVAHAVDMLRRSLTIAMKHLK